MLSHCLAHSIQSCAYLKDLRAKQAKSEEVRRMIYRSQGLFCATLRGRSPVHAPVKAGLTQP